MHIIIHISSGLHQVGVAAWYQWGTEATLWEHGDGDIHQVHADSFLVVSISFSSLYHGLPHTCSAVFYPQAPSKECAQPSDKLPKLWSYNEGMVSLQRQYHTRYCNYHPSIVQLPFLLLFLLLHHLFFLLPFSSSSSSPPLPLPFTCRKSTCLNCEANLVICVATGKPLLDYQTWMCPTCKHWAGLHEIKAFNNCPLCHSPIA